MGLRHPASAIRLNLTKTHRMPYLYRSFPEKEAYDYWLFCRKRPATKCMLWVFATLYIEPTHVCNNFLQKSPIISGSFAKNDLHPMGLRHHVYRAHSCLQQLDPHLVQGGEDPQDPLSLQVIFRERALYLVALLRKMTCNLRQPTGLSHPVRLLQTILDSRVNLLCKIFCKRAL